MVTSLLIPATHSSQNRHFACFSYRKPTYTIKTVQQRWKMLLEHKEETMVALSICKIATFGLQKKIAYNS
jgi:hypothetical protein